MNLYDWLIFSLKCKNTLFVHYTMMIPNLKETLDNISFQTNNKCIT